MEAEPRGRPVTPAFGLADRLRGGETVVTAWVFAPEPLVAEALARAAYGAVTLDMQHGQHDAVSVMRGVGAVVGAGKPAIVRVPVGDNAMASRALDFGASAVIAPMVNAATEAEALVAACKFPPVGARSWGAARAMALMGAKNPCSYLGWAGAGVLALAMIETTEALASLDAILAVPGLDGVFVGPSDLSLTLSAGAALDPFSPLLDEPIGRIAAAAKNHGKIAGIFASSAETARAHVAQGYRLVALGTDAQALAVGAETLLRPFTAD